MKEEISKKLYKRAVSLMPGGVNSPVRAFSAVGRTPLFIDRAKGDKIYDADGNEYIDYVCSWGPGILGHSHPKIIEAVKAACDKGLTFGAPTRNEVELAELIKSLMPSIEVMRMVNSGTEATMSAIRAARGYTDRGMIVKFKGCYHGHSDGLLVKAGSAALTSAVPDSDGVPKSYTQNTLVAEYNDENSVRELFEKYGNEIACIIVEPVAANMGVVLPKPGFLTFLRNITDKYNSVLIFDEVITGFRLGLGGAQEYYGIKPDMTALGKIVGGGMPMAVYGGRREIMQCISPIGKVYQAGTLSGNPIATTAGITALKILSENKNIYAEIDRKAAGLENALKEIGLSVNRIGSLLCGFFTDRKVENYDDALSSDTKKYAEFFSYLLENGIYIAPSQFEAMFISAAHCNEDIEKTCKIIKNFKSA
ncbi:MAG: glutamate-1-semialdehyde 2,1-aminomutase [Clostridiales bacterium]|nr:glutamate-1-semialdehyde 2,1-aminomutase [Clostridiales bacterium]